MSSSKGLRWWNVLDLDARKFLDIIMSRSEQDETDRQSGSRDPADGGCCPPPWFQRVRRLRLSDGDAHWQAASGRGNGPQTGAHCLQLKHGSEYVDARQDYYERQYKAWAVRSFAQRAKALSFELVPQVLEEAVT